jgi:hypothetical protein
VDAAEVDVVEGGGHGMVTEAFLEAVVADEVEDGLAEGAADHDRFRVEDVGAGP